MKILRLISHINSGRIWVIPIKNFLAKSQFLEYEKILLEKNIKNISDLFTLFKNQQLNEFINSLETSDKDNNLFFIFLEREFTTIDKLNKFNKIFICSLIGVLSLMLPFVSIEANGTMSENEAYDLFFSKSILIQRLVFLVFYLSISLFVFNFKINKMTVNLLIVITSIICFLHFAGIISIIRVSSLLGKLNVSASPYLGLIIGFIITIFMIGNLSKAKTIIKNEIPKHETFEY